MSQSPPSRPMLNDRYEIHGRIGRGGMADVYLARDQLLDRPVAVKVLFPEFATDPSFVERFRREAQAAANLTHPNVVGVYDWGQQGSTYFIVMEYVNGRSLADIIRSDGALEPKRACDVASEVAAALGFAHRSGVIHRDIKPANILVSNQGVVKVADFGIARALNAATEQGLTQAGAVMGTATYFSPEQAQGQALDPRSDLYSLGVVLYEMLTGQPPFSGDNPVSIAYKQVHDQPVPPSQRRPGLPEGLEAVTLKLLSKNLGSRYANADELRADLRRFRDTGAVRPTTTIDSPTMAVPALAGAAVGGAGAGAAGVMRIGTTDATRTMAKPTKGPPPASGGTYPPYEEPRRKVGWFVVAVLAGLALVVGIVALVYSRLNNASSAELVTVANVVGQPATDAQNALRALGLTPVTTNAANATIASGVVVSQTPNQGERVKSGTDVTLVVSTGKAPITLPDLIGKSQSDATNALDQLGIKNYRVDTKESADVPQGQVISQDPVAGPIKPDTIVVLTVSAGPGQIPIDNVVGLDQTRAAAILGKNFDVGDPVYEQNDTVPANKVIRTEPAVLQVVAKGSKVTIVVSSGPSPVTVPLVKGLTESAARDKLQTAGLLSTVVYVDLPFGSPDDGKVISQLPVDGTPFPKGQAVTITVGKAGPPPSTTTTTPTTTGSTTTTTSGSTTTGS